MTKPEIAREEETALTSEAGGVWEPKGGGQVIRFPCSTCGAEAGRNIGMTEERRFGLPSRGPWGNGGDRNSSSIVRGVEGLPLTKHERAINSARGQAANRQRRVCAGRKKRRAPLGLSVKHGDCISKLTISLQRR